MTYHPIMDPALLRELLNHLYDPTYHAPPATLAAFGLDVAGGMPALRAKVLALIESLRPPDSVPREAMPWRLYRVLEARYVRDLTQREAAEELAVTVRHLARLQSRAIELLAEARTGQVDAVPSAKAGGDGLRQQIAKEVTSLYEQVDEATYDLTDAVQTAVELAMPVAFAQHTAIRFARPSEELRTAAPQAAVRQATLSALTYLLRQVHDGEVQLALRRGERAIELEIEAQPIDSVSTDEPWLVQELLVSAHGELETASTERSMRMLLRLPLEPGYRVLAIDDNSDQLHFYTRCVAGSRLVIQPLRDGRQALSTARNYRPDAIVLDVMLPNCDGWELLTQLANDPATRAIPIIVCSVVNEPELALSLGASLVVAKPITRAAFLDALQQVLPNGARGSR
ncbi:MAG: response regulator [Anaerolineales bacterium]